MCERAGVDLVLVVQPSRPPGFVQANQCNNRCTCYRDCGYDGEPVCGSDGQLYQNQCQMECFCPAL
uniref:Kazal-like domain-containing protein n=1 Tax=Lates calcarifer TaxID=8187 RepID=A0A4W6G5M4_LATCA